MTPSLVYHAGSELLEGPVFDHQSNHLYFVSILDGLVHCYDPDSKEILHMALGSPVSCIFLLGHRRVLAASKNGFFEVDFNTMEKQFAFQLNIPPGVRYNDGIRDSAGRILIGTMGFPVVKEKAGKVYSFFRGQQRVIIEDTTISNGMAFSADHTLFYFIDTPTRKVARYRYDPESGDVEFDSHAIEFTGAGSPDGMCMDRDGMLWIAEWGGGCVSKWDPRDGRKLEERKLPCPNVTSCCFDGFSNLYVTTAKSEAEDDKYGGGLFYIDLHQN